MAQKSWFKMSAAPGITGLENEDGTPPSVARVDITGPIGGWEVSGSEFLRELKSLGDVDSIDLRIHSPGGDVLDGWAIANGLKNHAARVVARIEGQACSMASVVAMAADEVQMPKNGYLMIHNVSGGAYGGAEDLRDLADLMEKLQSDIADFYVDRTGLDRDEIVEMMNAETWMNGTDAVEKGFAHTLLDEVQAAACATDWSIENRFQNIPEDLAVDAEEVEEEAQEEEVQEEEPSAIKNLMARLGITKDATKDDWTPGAENATELVINALESKVSDLEGKLESAEFARDEAKVKAEELAATVAGLEADAKSVEAALAEHGFDLRATDDLPEPMSNDQEGPTSGSILDHLESMPKGVDRSDFFAKNRDAILRAYSDRQRGEG